MTRRGSGGPLGPRASTPDVGVGRAGDVGALPSSTANRKRPESSASRGPAHRAPRIEVGHAPDRGGDPGQRGRDDVAHPLVAGRRQQAGVGERTLQPTPAAAASPRSWTLPREVSSSRAVAELAAGGGQGPQAPAPTARRAAAPGPAARRRPDAGSARRGTRRFARARCPGVTPPDRTSGPVCEAGRTRRGRLACVHDPAAVDVRHRPALGPRVSGAEYRLANPARTDRRRTCRPCSTAPTSSWSASSAVAERGRTVSTRCCAPAVPAVVLGGEQQPDAELMELSTVPGGVVAEAHGYLADGRPGQPGAPAPLPRPTPSC